MRIWSKTSASRCTKIIHPSDIQNTATKCFFHDGLTHGAGWKCTVFFLDVYLQKILKNHITSIFLHNHASLFWNLTKKNTLRKHTEVEVDKLIKKKKASILLQSTVHRIALYCITTPKKYFQAIVNKTSLTIFRQVCRSMGFIKLTY